MELIKVPTDINDIADLTEFRSAIETINNFNKNLQKFGQKILDDKFVKTATEWKKILTQEVLEDPENKKLLESQDWYKLIFDYETKKLDYYDRTWCPTTGDKTGMTNKISFSNDGTVLIINQSYEVTNFRGVSADWRTLKGKIKIDYVNGKILRHEE